MFIGFVGFYWFFTQDFNEIVALLILIFKTNFSNTSVQLMEINDMVIVGDSSNSGLSIKKDLLKIYIFQYITLLCVFLYLFL